METLARSSWNWKLILKNHRDRDFLTNTQIRCLPFPPLVQIPISLQNKRLFSILASSLSSSDPQIYLEDSVNQTQDQSKTVHVKFQLQKECSFGEQFYIVGDDPVFGSWDPSCAIPLEWSDGHVWTVELDIPIEKSIIFKFMLKGPSRSILWQPDPDRILQTWETENQITVSEDWDNAELQKVVEEGATLDQNEESTISSEMLNKESIISGITNPMENTLAEKPMAIVAENISEPEDQNEESTISSEMLNKESIISGITNPMENTLAEKPMAMVAENISEPVENHQVNINNRVSGGATSIISSGKEHVGISSNDLTFGANSLGNNGRAVIVEDGNSFFYEGGPVLVPGLTSFPIGDVEEASPTEVEKNITSDPLLGSDKAKVHIVPELDLKEELDNGSPRLQEIAEMMHYHQELTGKKQVEKPQLVREQDQHSSEEIINDVLEKDVQWGRRTLQKFFANLGFF